MAFVSLSLLELFHSFNIKSNESIFKVGLLKNKYLIGAFTLGTILQVGVVTIMPSIFSCTTLTIEQWLVTLAISISPIIIMELQKKINEIKFGKRMYPVEKLG